MDRLDELIAIAGPLLGRADEILAGAGAPATHPVHALWRRVRLTSLDAVQAVSALRPDDVAGQTPDLRAYAARYVAAAAALPAPQEWTGEAAQAYDATRRDLAGHLGGDAGSLAGRLAATADLTDALLDWMRRSRSAVAAALAEVLGSVEAVRLVVDDGAEPVGVPLVMAAADVVQRLLDAVADCYERAAELMDDAARQTAVAPTPGRAVHDLG
ncbi:MAG TPA: hypothetical protein VFO77_09325 [Actinoplanes sp.]|nr:hypothetical protein [Actinoplanes sp.]